MGLEVGKREAEETKQIFRGLAGVLGVCFFLQLGSRGVVGTVPNSAPTDLNLLEIEYFSFII